MNDTDFLIASQALQLTRDANKLDGPYKRQETLKILERIRDAASSGLFSITVYDCADGIIADRLINLGYIVNIYSGFSYRDDTASMKISWC